MITQYMLNYQTTQNRRSDYKYGHASEKKQFNKGIYNIL